MSLKILFIGGTGIISSACSRLAIEQGLELYLLNRGQTNVRPVPKGARLLNGDIRSVESVANALQDLSFDVVVDWVAFTREHIETDLALFRGRTGQYIFISSASAYQTPPASLPVTESTPLDNPVWKYSQNKIACEERLWEAYRLEKFPITIVRPSHTYDAITIPLYGGWTVIDRMRRGQDVIVHGDGSSLWTLTHHADFAVGFNGLLGNSRAIGDAFHITSDEWLTWDQINQIMAQAAGVPTPHLVHVPSDLIATNDSAWGDNLLGDKTYSMIFDNSKIKRLVPGFRATIPFSQGAREIVDWFDANPDYKNIDTGFNTLVERILAGYRLAWAGREPQEDPAG